MKVILNIQCIKTNCEIFCLAVLKYFIHVLQPQLKRYQRYTQMCLNSVVEVEEKQVKQGIYYLIIKYVMRVYANNNEICAYMKMSNYNYPIVSKNLRE